ncbi:hypothetical protein SAMN05660649_01905 [Desulfotomaculum arcticum]|uniref:Uncharacterized protein n=1 Tax=Desulfotruncus arcticus DSM 17038 TaxID=1121424 RepID=A0A1I2SVD1_9FIRM|nr:hypothetical protein [Desulfotruncus arcticus]SFG53861.1 hypothetical protein SAMN05660649_01905 [Desulfotomaculum arcticum] [Desulfotruncus arcticus DSM 17038]
MIAGKSKAVNDQITREVSDMLTAIAMVLLGAFGIPLIMRRFSETE